jgi:20S proteasome subunit beta 6
MEEKQVPVKTAPVWIASSGCAADCEALKRIVRFEVRASQHWNTALGVMSISSLLSQVLYKRRNFPYYSFCVVAGLNDGEGAAYVYDAIGSFEQVAVATAGTGRELMQPILDRLFASPHEEEEEDSIKKSGIAVMPHVVETRVSCSADKAVARLIRGYKSVAERDIGVGDSVVLCVTQRDENGDTTCRVISVPLKTH